MIAIGEDFEGGFEYAAHPDPTSLKERSAVLEAPKFGTVFTDHMAMIRYSADKGWHDMQVGPRQPLSLDPATAVLHYAQEIFEGMKAYLHPGEVAALFRPGENAARFNESADRMAMPQLPEELFLAAVRNLVRADRGWIPEMEGAALYLRPFMFASEAFLGVRPATEFLFLVIACPVGPYFSGDNPSITIWASEQFSRAAPGGTGAAKCGGNYAASLKAQQEAIANDCDQVVFLDACSHQFVEELGGMNLFFAMDDGTIVTPPLGGTILPGITRDSIMQLARDEGHEIIERPYSIDEWQSDAESGKLRETLACGTAAVVTPVGRVRSNERDFTIGAGGAGQLATKLKDRLVGIQRGTVPDVHGWIDTL